MIRFVNPDKTSTGTSVLREGDLAPAGVVRLLERRAAMPARPSTKGMQRARQDDYSDDDDDVRASRADTTAALWHSASALRGATAL